MYRLVYLDWLRVCATICVVIIHVCAAGYVTTLQSDRETTWFIGNFFETISRWAVPGFVMISGALLLKDQREMSYWDFLKKRASKVIIPFVGWSVLFYTYGAYSGYFPLSIKNAIKLFINNGITYHFWFFYMIIGLYLITPLLRVFVKHAQKHHIEYFLILWLYASVITGLSNFLIGMKFSLELEHVTGYVGYFLLGYYLSHFEIKKFWRILSCFGLCIGMLSLFFLTYYYTLENGGKLSQYWYGYFSPSVFLFSAGLFILFRYNFNKLSLPIIFSAINKASLGIYIIHYWLLNNYLWRVFPQVNANFHQVLVIPINITITFVLSALITIVLQRIPIVKKLLP
jgi:surface polysaccharide O-acyltransferase-like enzyme